MAELGLAIAGLAAAWKGIADFGKLILQLTADDDRERFGLSLRLATSQFILRDWGDYWQVESSNGKFHDLEPARKHLIMNIIFQLRDSRVKALNVLRHRYGLSTEDNEDLEQPKPKQLSKLVDKIRAASKKAKEKGSWMIRDQELMSGLVEETFKLHECLQYLTYGSARFIQKIVPAAQSSSSLTETLDFASQQGQMLYTHSKQSLRGTLPSPTAEDLADVDHSSDTPTSAIFATKSLAFCHQVERIRGQVEKAHVFHGDDRLAEFLSEWWHYDASGAVVLECSDNTEDETPELTCAAIYYLSSCHRMIHSFDPEDKRESELQLGEMLFGFLESIISSDSVRLTEIRNVPQSVAEVGFSDHASNIEKIDLLWRLLQQAATGVMKEMMIIINGLEHLAPAMAGTMAKQSSLQAFMQCLQNACGLYERTEGASLRVLLCCKGHFADIEEAPSNFRVVDLTDQPQRLVNVMQELAVRM